MGIHLDTQCLLPRLLLEEVLPVYPLATPCFREVLTSHCSSVMLSSEATPPKPPPASMEPPAGHKLLWASRTPSSSRTWCAPHTALRPDHTQMHTQLPRCSLRTPRTPSLGSKMTLALPLTL